MAKEDTNVNPLTDMLSQLTGDVRSASTWSIILSVLMIAAGVLAIGAPGVAGATVTVIVGWLLIISGVLHFALAFSGGQPRAVVGEILLALLYGFIGYYLLSRPGVGLAALTAAITVYLFVEGILEFVLSYMLRPLPGAGWLLFDGIVTLALAIFVVSTWSSSASWLLGTLVGISMLFSGVTRLMLSIAVRRAVPA
jgi:uncharacterized membrane protein HdeD (DUF308 family)